MLNKNKKWITDSRKESILLRADPEGVWRNQQSFRLNLRSGSHLIKKHPRIAIVLAMRQLPNLKTRPGTRSEFLFTYFYIALYTFLLAAIFYGFILYEMFGVRSWIVMGICVVVSFVYVYMDNEYQWKRADRYQEMLIGLLKNNPLHCAGCWYPLDPDVVDVDECVVCPECGAAWLIPSKWNSAIS